MMVSEVQDLLNKQAINSRQSPHYHGKAKWFFGNGLSLSQIMSFLLEKQNFFCVYFMCVYANCMCINYCMCILYVYCIYVGVCHVYIICVLYVYVSCVCIVCIRILYIIYI